MSDSNSACSHATDEEVVEALNTLLSALKLTNTDDRCLVPTFVASLVLSMLVQWLMTERTYLNGIGKILPDAERVFAKLKQRMLLDLTEPMGMPQ